MEARMAHEEDRPMTYADWMNLPDDARVELIDGVFYALASPTDRHVFLAGEIYRQLANHLLGKRCRPMQEFNVRFEESVNTTDAVEPDILVVCEPEKIRRNGIVGAPSLIVEVLSPSTFDRDQSIKLRLYQKNGVPEYWMVHQDSASIFQCVLVNGKYRMESIQEGRIVSTAIEGFSMDIQELYASIEIPHDDDAPAADASTPISSDEGDATT